MEITSSLFSFHNLYNPVPETTDQEKVSGSAQEAKRMRTMLKDLLKPAEKSSEHVGKSKLHNVFEEITGTVETDDKKEKLKKVSKYNYKEVANKIRQAKTSLSAAQAVTAAKRKVAELKRKISNGDGDPEELQLDLTHAKRMEMAARRKRHNLELEELVEHTRAGDERREKTEETSEDIKQAMTRMSEEEIEEKEDAVFEERQQMLDEAMENLGEIRSEWAEDMLADINAMIAEYGEDLLEELEDQMEQLECMEIVDPHMSEEKFEDLKRKHRAAENKAMMKADMDYLKGMIKYLQEKGGSVTGMSGGSDNIKSDVMIPSGLIFTAVTDVSIEEPVMDAAAPTFDVAL